MRAVATRTSGAVCQAGFPESNAVSTLQKLLHEAIALLAVHGAEVAGSARLRLIQRMCFGMNVFGTSNVMMPMTGGTAHVFFLSESGASMHADVEFLLGCLMTGRTVD